MIVGIGTDIVNVARFVPWEQYSPERLCKIFRHEELAPGLQAERLASRFAAKEAFYKALCAAAVVWNIEVMPPSLRSICPLVGVASHAWGIPSLVIDHAALKLIWGVSLQPFRTHLTLSHEKAMAIAVVILESV